MIRRLTILVVGAAMMALVSMAPVLVPPAKARGAGQISLMQTLASGNTRTRRSP